MIAKHILPVYYIHTCTVFLFYRNLPLKWGARNFIIVWQIPILVIYAIFIFLVCVAIDKIKNILLGKIEDRIINGAVEYIDRVILDTTNVIIPGLFEPPVRTLRATIPENESHIFR